VVDFANGNLCGVSIELNNVLSKLDEAKAEIKSKLDELASTATEAFLAKNNELSTLKSKLQTIEIPTVPKLNLQAEITSLLSQASGSAAYVVALAKVASEFKTDVEAKGLTLESLVTAAAVASDLVCSVIPNLEKEAGSTVAAVEKPVAVKQAVEKAVTEVRSVVWQNPDITSKVKSLVEKTANFKTTTIPPTADTPAFKLIPSSVIKNISIGSAGGTAPVAVAPKSSSERKNYVPDDKAAGFSYIKNTIVEKFSISGDVGSKLEMSGGNAQLRLKHRPTGLGIRVLLHPGENYTKIYVGRTDRERMGDMPEVSTDANKQFFYSDWGGRHLAAVIASKGHSYWPHPRTNWFILDKTFIFSPPITLTDHPGNIDSGGAWYLSDPTAFSRQGAEPFMHPDTAEASFNMRMGKAKGYNRGPGQLSDTKYNKKYGGCAVIIRYEFLEKYDPSYTVI
jgi:hypothetical protein